MKDLQRNAACFLYLCQEDLFNCSVFAVQKLEKKLICTQQLHLSALCRLHDCSSQKGQRPGDGGLPIKTSSDNAVYLKRHGTLHCYCLTSQQMKAKIILLENGKCNVLHRPTLVQLELLCLFSKMAAGKTHLETYSLSVSHNQD